MARSTFVYVSYIRTTPEKLWSALTDPEFMKQYWFGVRGESRWTAGSSWKNVSPQGNILDAGEIVEAVPPRRLVIRWQNQFKPELKAEGESLCTMELEPSVRRLADGHLQPEVRAGDRLGRSAGPLPQLDLRLDDHPRERRRVHAQSGGGAHHQLQLASCR